MLSWLRDKPSSVAVMNGVIAGLAGVTPASGFINSQWTILLGFLLGFLSYGMYSSLHPALIIFTTGSVLLLKHKLHIDDALDVSSVHGFTGIIGSLFIGFASQAKLNLVDGADGAFYGNAQQLVRSIIITL